MQKPRILVITRNLPPLRGGMERLNFHLLEELAVAYEVRVCCPEDCVLSVPTDVEATGVPLRPLSRFIVAATVHSVLLAKRFRPQLVLAGSGLTAPLAWMAAAAVRAKSAAYLHGLDIAAQHAVYKALWVPRFRALDLVLTNSSHTGALAEVAGVPSSRICIVHPGVTLPEWIPSKAATFRQRFGLGNRPIVLSLGRLTSRKGLVEFLERAMPALIGAVPDIVLVIIGADAVHSIKGGGVSQHQRISKTIQRLGLGSHVQLMGELDDTLVSAAMFASAALVFPVLDLPGDSEGFGMVAIEAAAHGVPTAAFAVGGVTDAVSNVESGTLVPSGDYLLMTKTLIDYCRNPGSELDRRSRRAFAANFEWSRFGERLRAVCAPLFNIATT